MTGKPIQIDTSFYFDKNWIENVLYFVLTEDEYVDNNTKIGIRFFHVFVNGMEYVEDGTVEESSRRIAHNNDNYELTSCLNKNTARRAILEINRVMKEYVLNEGLTTEFQ